VCLGSPWYRDQWGKRAETLEPFRAEGWEEAQEGAVHSHGKGGSSRKAVSVGTVAAFPPQK
jgi:hypothetical protein